MKLRGKFSIVAAFGRFWIALFRRTFFPINPVEHEKAETINPVTGLILSALYARTLNRVRVVSLRPGDQTLAVPFGKLGTENRREIFVALVISGDVAMFLVKIRRC